MNVKITTLSEDTANYGFLAEWGLSILVEAGGYKILVDTGHSFSAVHNAQLMGIDLSSVDYIVLTHGHVDHTGGLRDVLRLTGDVDVIAHPDIWNPKYTKRGQHPERYSGIPFRPEELEGRRARFILTREPFYISDNILTTGEIPMVSGYETIEDGLFIKEGKALRPDPFSDDLALIINTDFGLVVILGCAHRGMINTIRHAQKLTGKELVYAVIGGTHLYPASDNRLEKTIADLKEIGVQRLGASHCTGFYASARLAQEFGDTFFRNNSGTRIELPVNTDIA